MYLVEDPSVLCINIYVLTLVSFDSLLVGLLWPCDGIQINTKLLRRREIHTLCVSLKILPKAKLLELQHCLSRRNSCVNVARYVSVVWLVLTMPLCGVCGVKQ
jgi:hypothetical protein